MMIYQSSQSTLLASVALATVVAITPAVAQDSTANASASEVRPEEIIVTAQRRAQSLQDVPISITAITAASLAKQGIADTSTISQSTPGVDFGRVSNGATPFIRGVGNPIAALGNESPVAVYVDGVYRPTPQGGLFSFNNIERIEVLRGPQGTLFGRNATGGVIQIITKDPSHDPSMFGSIGYGNFDTIEANAYATTGLSKDLAVDVGAYFIDQGKGWGRNLTNGDDIFKTDEISIRTKLLWTPGDRTEVRMSADYDHVKSDVGLNLGFAPGSIGLDGVTTYSGFYNNRGDPTDHAEVKQSGISLQINHDLDWAKIVSISSYRHIRGNANPYDQDGTPVAIAATPAIEQRADSYTQELQLLSPSTSSLQWIVGGFYFRDKSGYSDITVTGAATQPFAYIRIKGLQSTESLAGFAQATLEVAKGTRVTTGIRYTNDKRSVVGSTDLGGALLIEGAAKRSFGKLTWRLGLDHDFGEDILAYASFNRGFKSGLFNTITPAQDPVRPEVLDAYEVGLKTQLFDRRLRFNIAAFYYDYKDVQLNRLLAGATVIYNAASARMKGVDFDFAAQISNNFAITGGAAYLDANYRSFPDAPLYTPQPTGGSLVTSLDAAGNRAVRAPKFTFNIGPSYTIETSAGTFDASLLYYHNSGYFWNPDNRLRQPSHDIVNGTLGWKAPSGRFGAKLWVKNLLDEKYYSYAEEQTLGDNTSPAAPRTYGVSLSVKFD